MPETPDYFHKHRKGKKGLNQICKPCANSRTREWVKKNLEKKKDSDRRYAADNAEKLKEYRRNYRELNKVKASIYSAEYRKNNKEKLKEKKKEYFSRPEVRRKRSGYNKKRKKYDVKYRMTCVMRSCLSEAASGRRGALRHVTWTVEQLKEHLERQFLTGMTWENYGEWHIDHIIPVKSFCYQRPEDSDFRSCWALSNLRPLWALDNCSKQDKVEFLI